MTGEPPDVTTRGAQASLEAAYIKEYLAGQGYALGDVAQLPTAQASELLRAASLYASMRLAEVETRSHFVAEIHGSTMH